MSSKNNKVHFHNSDHILIALAFIITFAVIIGYLMGRSTSAPKVSGPIPPADNMTAPSETETFCPADARMCPDGSYVGRSGPECEFAPCP